MITFGWLQKNKYAIGLDIGSSAIKAVQIARRSGQYRIQGVSRYELAECESDHTRKEQDMVQGIDACIQSLDTACTDTVCAVGGNDVVVRSFAFPPLPANEIPGAVHLEAAQFCSFKTDKSTVNYQLINTRKTSSCARDKSGSSTVEDQVTGVLAATPSQVIRNKQTLLEKSRARCVLMDVEGLALLNCLQGLRPSHSEQTLAILDVGNSHSTLAILPPSGLPFVRSLPGGGQTVVAELAAFMDTDKRDVTRQLHREDEQTPNEISIECLTRSCRCLADSVLDTLRYHDTQQSQYPVTTLSVTGGFALTERFVEILGSLLGSYSLELWNPCQTVDCQDVENEDEIKSHGPAYAVAIGLAMRLI